MQRLEGLIAAVHTPMNADGSVNPDRIGPIVDHMLDNRISGLYVLGSTGEGVSMTDQERRDVAAEYVRAAAGRLPVIVQVGHNSLAQARKLAAHAQSVGADAISATPPSYFKPADVDVLVDCLAEITADAPDVPFYYYHIPRMSGVECDVTELLRRGADRLVNLAGVKFSHPMLLEFQACNDLDGGRFHLLFGVDEMLLASLATGAVGAVGTTYTFAAPLYHRLIDAFKADDLAEARRCQALSVRMINTVVRFRPVPGFKAVMGMVGVDCGPTRLPLKGLDANEIAALRAELEKIGFFDWGVNPASR